MTFRKIGKEGKKWIKFRKKYLEEHIEWDGRFTCSVCGIRMENPDVDHIKERSTHPHLKYEKSNLRIICRKCHQNKAGGA